MVRLTATEWKRWERAQNKCDDATYNRPHTAKLPLSSRVCAHYILA
jgi:hypothetical protein